MNVKSASLNGTILEVYVNQSLGFLAHDSSNLVFKLNTALYSSKQAPRAWYERFSKFLLENNFKKC